VTAVAELAVGASRTTVLVENLTRTRIVQYAGASGDYNPLHSDEVFTTKVTDLDSIEIGILPPTEGETMAGSARAVARAEPQVRSAAGWR